MDRTHYLQVNAEIRKQYRQNRLSHGDAIRMLTELEHHHNLNKAITHPALLSLMNNHEDVAWEDMNG